MRQLLDLHAQVKSQETTLKALQGRLASNETIVNI
jgi:hypothetical protein